MMKSTPVLSVALAAALLLAIAGTAQADSKKYPLVWEVEVTNLTKGQTFTPLFAATTRSGNRFFELGAPASEALSILAEAGNTAPITETFEALGSRLGEAFTNDGLLAPGETRTFRIAGSYKHRYLSIGAMLIPTNDTFVALQAVRLPVKKRSTKSWFAPGYDAGSEVNDQDCDNIPGPRCGGAGVSEEPTEGDEGFVHVGNGFHDLGDIDEADESEILGPFTYDWRNPVARVTARRVR